MAFSPIYESAELCASCHQYTTPFGVGLLTTYSEYLASAYPARRIVCQSCHMPFVLADMVDANAQADPRHFINLHRMPGGHELSQLRRAIEMDWGEIRPTSDGMVGHVSVWNMGAGHAFPTGMPTRRVALEMVAQVHGREEPRGACGVPEGRT